MQERWETTSKRSHGTSSLVFPQSVVGREWCLAPTRKATPSGGSRVSRSFENAGRRFAASSFCWCFYLFCCHNFSSLSHCHLQVFHWLKQQEPGRGGAVRVQSKKCARGYYGGCGVAAHACASRGAHRGTRCGVKEGDRTERGTLNKSGWKVDGTAGNRDTGTRWQRGGGTK